MLFTNIAALVRQGVKLNFAVEASGDSKIEVTVTPASANPAANKSGVSLVAKTFTATPEEFDAEFSALLQTFCTSTMSLKEQLDAANQLIEQAGKQASESAVKAAEKSAPRAAAKPAASSKGAAATRPEPLLSGADSAAEEEDEQDKVEESSDVASAGSPTSAAAPSLELQL